jgi:hypothetical protein
MVAIENNGRKKWRSFVGSVLAFAALGPAVGNWSYVVWVWIDAAFYDSPFDTTLDVAVTQWVLLIILPVTGLPFAYVLGFLPAIVCGACFSGLALAVPSLLHIPKPKRGLIAGAIGVPVSAWGFTYWNFDPSSSGEAWLVFTIAGAVAAFVVGCYFPRGESLSRKSIQPTCEDARSG